MILKYDNPFFPIDLPINDNNALIKVINDVLDFAKKKFECDLFKQIKENNEKGIEFVKTDEEWDKHKHKYKDIKGMTEEKMKENYKRYGSIYGSKYSVQTEYGKWDTEFTM